MAGPRIRASSWPTNAWAGVRPRPESSGAGNSSSAAALSRWPSTARSARPTAICSPRAPRITSASRTWPSTRQEGSSRPASSKACWRSSAPRCRAFFSITRARRVASRSSPPSSPARATYSSAGEDRRRRGVSQQRRGRLAVLARVGMSTASPARSKQRRSFGFTGAEHMKTSPSCVTANATKRFPIGLAFPFRFALTALALGMMACRADDTHVNTGGPTTTGNESGGASGSSSEGGTGGAGDSGGALDGGGDSGRCASREVRIVAHQDDELLFMNPDLLESLRAGHCVRTVYLTAGDAGKGMAYAMTRDLGMRAVYAEMAVAADVWTETQAAFANKSVLISTLQGTDVSLV